MIIVYVRGCLQFVMCCHFVSSVSREDKSTVDAVAEINENEGRDVYLLHFEGDSPAYTEVIMTEVT